mmetsp:Transcript_36721/g.146834  ORF Transcript_36721/g.146834 Transcript_36721/m.146834 type:complete len:907 (-) Transcript_36721:601-3321(-)
MGENGGKSVLEEFDPCEKLVEDPNLVRGRLENGLAYAILPNARPANRVEAHLVVSCGSLDEEDHEQGLAHLVEHVVFCGTKKLVDSEKVKSAMASIGMSFGADVNASTDFRETKYTFHGPIERPQNFPIIDGGEAISDGFQGVLEILYEICFQATIEEDSVTTEKAAVLSELQLRNTVEFRSDKAFIEKFHGETPIPTRYPIGLEESVKGFTAADVRRFYDKFYVPGNMELYCVGSFDKKGALELIKSIFEKAERKEVPSCVSHRLEEYHRFDRIDPERKFATFSHNLLAQTVVCFAVKVPSYKVQEFEHLRINLVDSICGSVFEERMDGIYKSMGNPIFTEFGWGYDDSHREGCAANVLTISCEPADFRDAVVLLLRESRRLCRYGILEGEMRRALHMLLKSLRQDAEQADTKQSSSIISDLINESELGDVYQSAQAQYELFQKASRTIDVETVNKRVRAVFSGLGIEKDGSLTPENGIDGMVGCGDCVVFVSGPQRKLGKITLDEINELVKLSAQGEIEAPADIDLPEYLFEDQPERVGFVEVCNAQQLGLEVVEPEKAVETESGAWFRTLPNGVRGAFQVTEYDAKHFILRVNVHGGSASMADEVESAALSMGLLTMFSGGAAGHPSHVISKYMSTHNIDLEVAVGFESARLDMWAGTAGHGLKRAFETLFAYFTTPVWETSSFERARKERMLLFEELQHEIERRVQEAAYLNLVGGDKRFPTSSKKCLRRINFDDLQQTIMRALDPAKMEVILVGDFDPKEAEMHFASYFGAMRGVGVVDPPRAIPDVRLTSNEDVTKLSVYDQENRAVVGFTGHLRGRWSMTDLDLQAFPGSYTTPKHADKAFGSRCLTVLSEIINNRLYKEIREEQKLTYWVSFGLSYLDTHDFSIVTIRVRATDGPLKI